jgi:hypothetical protein
MSVLTGWRVNWLEQNLVQWRDMLDATERQRSRPPEWIQRERDMVHEYETMLLRAKYPT